MLHVPVIFFPPVGGPEDTPTLPGEGHHGAEVLGGWLDTRYVSLSSYATDEVGKPLGLKQIVWMERSVIP